MIRINSNKIGNIYIQDNFLKKVLKSIIIEFLPSHDLLGIDFEIKWNSLKGINIKVKKSTRMSKEEQRNLVDNLVFTLSSKYHLFNKVITFIYEK